ncbi:MAG: aminotransferase class V-fold PLP-dependent enzyme [Bacteroidia bacterium]|nr:aminotransferase class V-fold PLP-dependent enzyme [Bacteroidia bacterium]
MNPEEVQRYRAETPGTQHVIHFNNAGSSLLPTPVFDAVDAYLKSEYLIGGYETCDKYADGFAFSKEKLGELIGAKADEIALLESATTAWYKAFLGLNLQEGDVVLTSQTEYVSNFLGFLREKKYQGIEIQIIPNNQWGEIDVEALEKMISPSVKLIAISHIPTNGGLVQPAAEVGRIAHAHNIPYLLDACQTIGQIPVDVADLGCDMLSATGRKFLRGPRGTGFLYVREDFMDKLDPPLPDLFSFEWDEIESYSPRQGATRFENYEKHFAGQIGLGIAADYALKIGVDKIWARSKQLSELLRKKLNQLDGVQTRDLGREPCAIVTFTVSSKTAGEVKLLLNEKNINTSFVDAGGALMDMAERKLGNMIRASVHYYNTEEEIETFIDALKSILSS